MKMKWKVWTLICLITCLGLAACGNNDKGTEQTDLGLGIEEQGVGDVGNAGATAIDTGNMNLLTGETTLSDEAVGKRPVAVMINNLKVALPQDGIGSADVIFEMPVEGGASRTMALFGDYTKVPKICSIRSCRKYFPEISQGFDAVYVCSGMNGDVKNYINTLGLTLYEGDHNTGNLFGRDQARRDRGVSLEHTLYFDGTQLPAVMEKKEQRTEIDPSKSGPAFNFSEETVVPTGEKCTKVFVDFSASTSTFTYDEASKKYLKQIGDQPQVDGLTGVQISFDNVIVGETSVGKDANGANLTVDWTGGKNSTAYYISNGMMQPIYWEKKSVDGPMMFYTMDGKELAINTGKTYVGLTYGGNVELE